MIDVWTRWTCKVIMKRKIFFCRATHVITSKREASHVGLYSHIWWCALCKSPQLQALTAYNERTCLIISSHCYIQLQAALYMNPVMWGHVLSRSTRYTSVYLSKVPPVLFRDALCTCLSGYYFTCVQFLPPTDVPQVCSQSLNTRTCF